MRSLKILAPAALLLVSMPAAARERLFGWCEQGNQTVSVQSYTSTTKVQRSYPSCTVTVYGAGTLVLSTLYSDNSGTAKANPFTANADGSWSFYANNARYDVVLSGGGMASPITLADRLLFDNSGAVGITSLNALTGATQTFANDTNVRITSAGTTHTLGWNGTLSVARGGSGAGTFTANGVLLGNGTSAFGVSAAGTANQVFRVPSAGGAPAFGSINLASSAAVTGVLPIVNGGTGKSTGTTAFNALSPLSAKGDLIGYTGSSNSRLAVGSNTQCLIADSTQALGIKWGSCTGASPMSVSSGGTGAATLTGAVIGTGTTAMTAVAAASQLQFLRRKANQTSVTYEFTTPQNLLASDFTFSQAPGGTLTGGVGASVTLTPGPLGVNGSDPSHPVYLSGGTGTPEAVTITGGSCTSGASSCTLTFTPANDHSGAWTISSATGGVQEAICYTPSIENHILVGRGTTTLNANVGLCGKTSAVVEIANGATIAGTGTWFAPTANAWIEDHRTRQNQPPCTKYTVAYTNAALVANGTTADVTLFTLPQYGKIHGVTVKHSVVFSDGGGAMTEVSVSLGDSSSNTAYTSATNIGEATAVADTTFQDTALLKSTTMAAAGRSVFAHFIATGANFGDGAKTALISGSVDIWACWSTIQ